MKRMPQYEVSMGTALPIFDVARHAMNTGDLENENANYRGGAPPQSG